MEEDLETAWLLRGALFPAPFTWDVSPIKWSDYSSLCAATPLFAPVPCPALEEGQVVHFVTGGRTYFGRAARTTGALDLYGSQQRCFCDQYPRAAAPTHMEVPNYCESRGAARYRKEAPTGEFFLELEPRLRRVLYCNDGAGPIPLALWSGTPLGRPVFYCPMFEYLNK